MTVGTDIGRHHETDETNPDIEAIQEISGMLPDQKVQQQLDDLLFKQTHAGTTRVMVLRQESVSRRANFLPNRRETTMPASKCGRRRWPPTQPLVFHPGLQYRDLVHGGHWSGNQCYPTPSK
jgi:hypothetical protein